MVGRRAPLEERFWNKVEIRGADECWPWLATKNNKGYGLIWKPGEGRGNNKTLAHRVSYELENGPIQKGDTPQSLVVQHTCDNPNCVNPAHLVLGTMKSNYHDMATKGRRRIVATVANLGPPKLGEQHYMAKLTAEKVRELRARRLAGETYAAMARELGLNKSTVRRVVCGTAWRHVT